jgi:hypothetical protein
LLLEIFHAGPGITRFSLNSRLTPPPLLLLMSRIFSDALCYPLFYADAGSAISLPKLSIKRRDAGGARVEKKIENPRIYFSLPARAERIERCW